MADPWAKYVDQPKSQAVQPPTPSADQWNRYTGGNPAQPVAPSKPAAAAPDPNADWWTRVLGLAPAAELDPNWKSTGNAFLDFMGRPLAKNEGIGASLRDVGLSAGDALTMGYGSKALGAQDAVAEANRNLGILSPLVQGSAYVAGPGKLLGPLARGVVGAAPEAIAAGRIGSALTGGLEGATAGALGAEGHDQDVTKGALTGGLTGGLLGGAFGGSGPRPQAPDVGTRATVDPTGVPVPPTGMYAAKSVAYRPLDQIGFNTQNAAIARGDAAVGVSRNPNNFRTSIALPTEVQNEITKLISNPEVTGGQIQDAIIALRKEGDIGNTYANSLENMLRYDQPLAPPGGGPAPAPGEAYAAKQAGDIIHGRIESLNRLTPDDGSAPTPGAIKATKSFYDPGTPEYNALDALQNQSRLNWWHLRHPLGILAGEGIAQGAGYIDPENKYPWLREGGHALAGLSLYSGLPAGLNAVNKGGFARALNEARYTVGTGQPMTTPTGRVGNTLLQLMLGRQANQSSQ